MKAKQSKQKQSQLSRESYENLQRELQDLEQNQLPAVVERIAKAREQGDLSENSEYKDAKDQQELLEVRIGEIRQVLDNAKVVDDDKNDDGIRVGSKVTLKNARGKKSTYVLIAEYDKSAIEEDTISVVSPIGQTLMGQKKGAKISVETPAGVREFEVTAVG
ncbi:transcription elongation factor GreA [bacterium]|nr:transcription elongation factor GreA [bacterium]MBQ6436366.1 transcription elongation factor GreA [bacterium]